MKKALQISGWIAVLLVGLFVYNAFPGSQPIVGWTVGAIFAYKVLSELVESAVRRVLWDDLLELRRQSHTNTDRLEVVDRKVSAILADAIERRRRPPENIRSEPP